MNTPTKSRTYQLGAAHERQAYLQRLKRRVHRMPLESEARAELVKELQWLYKRTERFDKAEGGLGRRKAKK